MVDLQAWAPLAAIPAATNVASSKHPVGARDANANASANSLPGAPASAGNGNEIAQSAALATGDPGPASRYGAAPPSPGGMQMVYVYDAQAHKALVRVLNIITQAIPPDAAAEDAGSAVAHSATQIIAPHIDTSA